jgi:quinol monooxygenase YgiN
MERFVFAHVTAKPGSADILRAAAETQAPFSRAEEGCLAYGVFQDLDDDHKLWFHARWRDAESLQAHQGGAHLVPWHAAVDAHAIGPVTVSVTRRVNT